MPTSLAYVHTLQITHVGQFLPNMNMPLYMSVKNFWCFNFFQVKFLIRKYGSSNEGFSSFHRRIEDDIINVHNNISSFCIITLGYLCKKETIWGS